MNGRGGFTLIEVLIAMAITALVATLAFSSLSATLSSVESLQQSGSRVAELNRAWTLVSRDLGSFVVRPVRDEFGAAEAALRGGEAVERSLTFTRTGWHNPNRQIRSHLQRVSYRLEDETLWRESWNVLDRTSETEVRRVELLTGVTAFDLAFLGESVEVRGEELDTDDWPDNWGITAGENVSVQPPQALELRLELDDLGEIRWLYELPRS